MDVVKYIVFSIPDFAIIVFLIIELVRFVKKAIKEKNWSVILKLLTDYMMAAEEMFDSGAERKEWVLKMIESSAKNINYELDIELISQKIDELCAMSKVVNNGRK